MADTKIGAMEGGDLGLTPAETEEFWLQNDAGSTDYYWPISTAGIVYRRRGLITDSTTTRTLAATDDGQHIRFTNASGCAVTIPKNSDVALPVGFRCHLRQTVAGPAGLVTTVLGGSPPVTLNLPTGMTPPRFMGAMAIRSADETTANYTARAAIPWNGTDVYDTDAFHDPASSNTKMIIPSGLGITKVRISGYVLVDLTGSGEYCSLSVYKGGALHQQGAVQFSELTTTLNMNSICSAPMEATATDDFELALLVQTDTSVTVTASSSNFALEVVEIDAQGTSVGKDTEFWIEKIATDEWDIGGMFM